MNKKQIIQNINKIILILSLLLLPFIYTGLLFGLAGSTSKYFLMITVGYIGVVVFSLISIFKYKFFPIVLISILLIVFGITFNDSFWGEHNQNLCKELRAEPSCVEDECGFDCTNLNGQIFFTGPEICKDKDPKLCVIKQNHIKQTKATEKSALKVYSKIVDKIIASPTPTKEDFENELVAVYHCLQEQYGPGAKAELMAIQVLKKKNLTQQQLNKYYSYLSRNGNIISTSKIVAGLPNGDAKFSCEYIGIKKISNNSVQKQVVGKKQNEFFCNSDSDCIPFIYECGNCEDYSIAINKKFLNQYQEKYWDKCKNKEQRVCDALPKGKGKCDNNKCILIK